MSPEQKAKIRDLQEQLEETKREKENLELMLRKKRKGKSKSPQLDDPIPLGADMEAAVNEKTASELWCTCKFLATPRQKDQAMVIVMNIILAVKKLFP